MDIIAATTKALPKLDLKKAKSEAITGGASDRKYHRVTMANKKTLVVMKYTDERADNIKFAPASDLLKRLKVPCPKILAHEKKKKLLWIEDLGEDHLFDHRGDTWAKRKKLYTSTIDAIAELHKVGEDDLEEEEVEQLEPPFDHDLYKWEHKYFFKNFLSTYSRRAPSYVNSLGDEPEFAASIDYLADLPRTLVHRDLQSQNVLLKRGKPYFIDYQGLRLGRPEYDIASLVYDPYMDLEDSERAELVKYAFKGRKEDEWKPIFYRAAAQRLMQALGAFTRLGNDLGKKEYLPYIPIGLESLCEVLIADDTMMPRLLPYLSPEALSLDADEEEEQA